MISSLCTQGGATISSNIQGRPRRGSSRAKSGPGGLGKGKVMKGPAGVGEGAGIVEELCLRETATTTGWGGGVR